MISVGVDKVEPLNYNGRHTGYRNPEFGDDVALIIILLPNLLSSHLTGQLRVYSILALYILNE